MNPDIRWHQRFENYTKALQQLTAAVRLAKQRPLSELEQQGLIKGFEFTHELAWNVMKDYLFFQGISDLTGSRDAIRESFHKGLIENGALWMEMIKSRNQTSHTYNPILADEIADQIIHQYFHCFQAFQEKMELLKKNDASNAY